MTKEDEYFNEAIELLPHLAMAIQKKEYPVKLYYNRQGKEVLKTQYMLQKRFNKEARRLRDEGKIE